MKTIACVLASLLILALPLLADATVKSVSGDVTVLKHGSSQSVPLKLGDSLPEGSTIYSKDNGMATITLTSKSAIQISGKSEVQISEVFDDTAKPKVKVNLRSGNISALIREKGKEMDFKIETPHGIVAARGTFYAVSVKNGKTTAAVREGEIDVVSSKEK
jgi:hypothetical protein